MGMERFCWSSEYETIENFKDGVKQLGDMHDKNKQKQVRTINMVIPHRGTYKAIMWCDTFDEIVDTFNQLEELPLIHNPTEAKPTR